MPPTIFWQLVSPAGHEDRLEVQVTGTQLLPQVHAIIARLFPGAHFMGSGWLDAPFSFIRGERVFEEEYFI